MWRLPSHDHHREDSSGCILSRARPSGLCFYGDNDGLDRALAANWDVEAARLIRTLDLPAHLQESARDYASKQMARGTAPKPALEQWVAEQRDRGAMIRSRREVSATDECIARPTG